MDFRASLGLDESVLTFGDSGGYQIATGTLKWSNTLREQIFHWLEANSDIAANIDIPPRNQYDSKFDECLKISADNFAWFEKHQSGKTDFLNIVQGNSPAEIEKWYHTVKGFEFSGWGIGGSRKMLNFMFTIALFLKNREFEKASNKYYHVLGISKPSDFFILHTFQRLLNDYYGKGAYVSTDSSTAGRYPVFGVHILNLDLRDNVFRLLEIPRHQGDLKVSLDTHLPCTFGCPACSDLTYGKLFGTTPEGLQNYSQEANPRMTLHNLHGILKGSQIIKDLVNSPDEVQKQILEQDLFALLFSMEEMFADPDNALNVYERYLKVYAAYGGEQLVTTNKNSFNKFFQ